MNKVVSLAKRRGFIYPGSEIYGGLANAWDYGPLGVELKNNIKQLWWERFVSRRENIVGVDTALLMSSDVWEASGHLREFSDPLVECKKCHERFREDNIGKECPNCNNKTFTRAKQFNLMLKTFLGPVEEDASVVYFRPETAQGMFVNYKNVLNTTRQTLPFGIAQIGKAFRNEITPGNFIFRTREFEQMEIEFFVRETEWEERFTEWQKEMRDWIKTIGIDLGHVHEREVPKDERAHYSKRTVDFDYEFPFGVEELYGLAYRGDFDLKNHEKHSGVNLKYRDPDSGKEFWPHVIEPTWGVDRTVLAVLLDSYREEKGRVFLKLSPALAPYKAAVFPLLANKAGLVKKAREVYNALLAHLPVAWDDRGNIGKRYYAQDEIGTPYCMTIDFDTLKDDTVTVRNRDTTKQTRVEIKELRAFLEEQLK